MIRATIVLLVAHLVIPRLRTRSAAERHLLWTAAFATSAMLPVLGALLPAWQLEWARHVIDALPSMVPVRSWTSTPGPDVVVRATGLETAWTLAQWSLVVWFVGALVALLLVARDVVRLVPLVRSSREAGARERAAGDRMATAMRVSPAPAILFSARAVMPMTWGIGRARVLLPPAATAWPADRLEAVLAHELAHVRRCDWLVHVLTQLACATYWFHPLFWSAERAIGREAEQAADDEALRVGQEPSGYAAHLVAIVREARIGRERRLPAVAMARRAHLERRVAALLRIDANRRSISRRAALIMCAGVVAMAWPLAAMTTDVSIDVVVNAAALPPAVMASESSSEAGTPAHKGESSDPAVVRRTRARGIAAETADPITPPEIAEYTTPPLYSDEAKRSRLEGIVTIAIHVDEAGRLTTAQIVNGLGAGLDQNALVALRQWRFRPATRAGVPVATDAEVEIEFNLRNEGVNELIANDMATLVGPGVTPPRVVRTSGVALNHAGARGSVVLDVVLLQDGSPKIVRILRSLSPDADEIAVRHFEQWRFTPAMKSGVPVKVRMNAEVHFHG